MQSAFWREKPIEELYEESADPYEVNNLADRPEHKKTLDRLREVLEEHLLTTRDTGFLPESDMLSRAASGPIRAMAADDARYPLQRIMAAAELAAARDVEAVPRLIALMKDVDPAVRYWAALGCTVRKEKASGAVRCAAALAQGPLSRSPRGGSRGVVYRRPSRRGASRGWWIHCATGTRCWPSTPWIRWATSPARYLTQ